MLKARDHGNFPVMLSRAPSLAFGELVRSLRMTDGRALQPKPLLVVLGGLPGTGKTTIARQLAAKLQALHLRIDTIEHALRTCGVADLRDIGYRVAYGVAEENLLLGRTVIADSVNPLRLTRDAWREVAARAGAEMIEVETICSDIVEHRRRLDTRFHDIPGLAVSWQQVISREYEPWDRAHLLIDTATHSLGECVAMILDHLQLVGSG
jgi:predicted kinase